MKQNLDTILANISIASKKSKYNENVILVPASKTVDIDVINQLPSLGIHTVGENRAQELLTKYPYAKGIEWHFIGRLQTNKVKYIIDKVTLIHSVDRLELLKEIDRQAKKHDKVQDILVEVNMGSEESKGGVSPDAVLDFCKDTCAYPNVRLCGLMAIMPFTSDLVYLNELYTSLRGLYDNVKSIERIGSNVVYLSAGMSEDYEIAIRNGANLVRVGSALFGRRVYNG